MERAHDEAAGPAPVAPPRVQPLAAAPVTSMSPGRQSPASMSPRQVLALQRSVGNGAVAALLGGGRAGVPRPSLARQAEPHTEKGASASTPKGLVASDFSCAVDEPSAPPKATASTMKREGDEVTFDSAVVTASATVTWGSAAAPGATPAAPDPSKPTDASVGFINTILASERTLTYTEDGTPGGKVVALRRSASPQGTRDAWWSKKGGAQVENTNTFKPFYSRPENLRPGESKTITFQDKPGDTAKLVAKSMDGKRTGKLAKMTGADRFRLSVGVVEFGEPARPIHLVAHEWTVPWDLEIPQIEGEIKAGRDVGISKYKGSLQDLKPGEGFGVGDAKDLTYPVDDADIAGMSLRDLIVAIPFARDWGDAEVWAKMSARVRDLGPRFKVTLEVKIRKDYRIDMVIGIGNAPRAPTPRKISEWFTGAQSVEFQLPEVMDPQDLGQRMTLFPTFTRDGGTEQKAPWTWPFDSMRSSFIWDREDVSKGRHDDAERRKKAEIDIGTEVVVTGQLVT